MTTLNRLTITLWAAHTRALHAGMHGSKAADELTLGQAAFDRQYAAMKPAWCAAAMAMLSELKAINASDSVEPNCFHQWIDHLINEPASVATIDTSSGVTEIVLPAKPAPNPSGIPGNAHIA